MDSFAVSSDKPIALSKARKNLDEFVTLQHQKAESEGMKRFLRRRF